MRRAGPAYVGPVLVIQRSRCIDSINAGPWLLSPLQSLYTYSARGVASVVSETLY